MDKAGEHRWDRSRYPLQASGNGSVQPPMAKSQLVDMDSSSSDSRTKTTSESQGPAPWHRAVTEGQVRRSSIFSRPGSDSDFSSRPSTEDAQAADESSTTIFGSHRSTSLQSVKQPSPSQSSKGGSILPSDQLSSNGDDASSDASPWTRRTYPINTRAETVTDHCPPTAPPDQEDDELPSEAVEVGQSERIQRTLRRTPRSRRIKPPIPLEVVIDDHSTAKSGGDSWKRRLYPGQSTTKGLTIPPSSPLSSHEEPVPQESTPREESAPEEPTLQKDPAPQEKPMPQETAVLHVSKDTQKAPTRSGPWGRRTYPMQPSVSGSIAASSPFSSSESESENEDNKSVHEPEDRNQTVSKTKLWNRSTYPLQAPASNANLKQSPTPPPSPGRTAEHTSDTGVATPSENGQSTPRRKKFNRQIYPLQSPASTADLQSSPTPPSSPEVEAETLDDETADQVQEEPQTLVKSKVSRRRGYPLQAPATMANLKQVPPQTQSMEKKGSEEKEAEASLKEDKSSTKQARENELAARVIQQWRRQAYPLQSPKDISPFRRSEVPHSFGETSEQNDKARPIHLPKNIRAVTNADKHDSSGRTIVICLDGTGDKFDNDNSNIVHIISALKKDDPKQVTYYQAGIGTYGAGGLSGGVSAAMDMAVGSGLGLHIRDSYNFLMHSYKEGDKICIFGFSRGAYTARCLAGMIHKVGLLPARNAEQIPFAYEFYAKDTPEGWKQSEDFKNTFCIDVSVHFLGCFDSVASVGFIPRQLPLSSTPTSKPRYFRHAMALDERRAKFKICRHAKKDWQDIEEQTSTTDVNARSTHSSSRFSLPTSKSQNDTPPKYPPSTHYGRENHPNVTDEEYEELIGSGDSFDTDVLEVWFTGAHADIGGGAVANDERHKLAHIPLRWMIRQAFECNTGIIFKTKILAEQGLDVHTLWPKYERLAVPAHEPPPSMLEKYQTHLPPRSVRRSKLVPSDREHEKGESFYRFRSHTDDDWTPEQVEDFYDAMSPLHDQLVEAPNWWILEVWPVEYKVPIARGEVATKFGMNLGRYRGVDDYEPNVHWTVLHRVEHMGYKIQARTAAHTTWKTVV